MESNIAQIFGSQLYQKVYNLETQKTYTLIGVTEESLIVKDDSGKETSDSIFMFKILVSGEKDAAIRGIPHKYAAVVTVNIKPLEDKTSHEFLNELMDVVYKINNTTHQVQFENRENRERIFVEIRNVIIASWFCAFEHGTHAHVTLSEAGGLFEKDHSSVYSCINYCNNRLDTEPSFRRKYHPVWSMINTQTRSSRLHI